MGSVKRSAPSSASAQMPAAVITFVFENSSHSVSSRASVRGARPAYPKLSNKASPPCRASAICAPGCAPARCAVRSCAAAGRAPGRGIRVLPRGGFERNVSCELATAGQCHRSVTGLNSKGRGQRCAARRRPQPVTGGATPAAINRQHCAMGLVTHGTLKSSSRIGTRRGCATRPGAGAAPPPWAPAAWPRVRVERKSDPLLDAHRKCCLAHCPALVRSALRSPRE